MLIEGTSVVLKGSWDDNPDPPGLLVIRLAPIDHRFVYGFGWNPSTQGMLRAMERVGMQNKVVLDVGTGTGILAIAAAKMGAKKVYAVDHDKDALSYAQEAAALNSVEIEFGYPDHTDVLLANLGDAEFVADVAYVYSWMDKEIQAGRDPGTFIPPANAPTEAWLHDHALHFVDTTIATVPENSDVIGKALLDGLTVHTDILGEGEQRFTIVTLRRP